MHDVLTSKALDADQIRRYGQTGHLTVPGVLEEEEVEHALADVEAQGMVTAWVALDAATPENGCLYYGEGSNAGPVTRTWHRPDDPMTSRSQNRSPHVSR